MRHIFGFLDILIPVRPRKLFNMRLPYLLQACFLRAIENMIMKNCTKKNYDGSPNALVVDLPSFGSLLNSSLNWSWKHRTCGLPIV